MAFITLRQANVVASPGGTVKGSPLTNAEVDNNFANINIVIGFREDLITTANANLVAAVNEVRSDLNNLSSDSISNGTSNVNISTANGPIVISANLIPNVGNIINLGSNTNRFKDLFLSGNTINLGGDTISSASGFIKINNTNVFTTTGNIASENIDANSITTGTLSVARGGTGITSFGTDIATFLGNPTSANLAAAVTNETGSGALVFATSPTLVTPALGTPSSANLINAVGLPIINGTTGTLSVARGGTGNTTATFVNLAANVYNTLPVASGGTGVTTSTGTGAVVLSTSPTLVTPALGTPSSANLISAIGLPIVAGTTGTLSVDRGGTGNTAATFVNLAANVYNTLPVARGGTGINASSASNGQIIIGNGSGFTANTITGTTNRITVTNGVGAITLTTPQDLHTTATIQFAALGVGTGTFGSTGDIRATNNITAFFSSDNRYKENVRDIDNALDKVNHIGGKYFDWTDAYISAQGGADGYFMIKSDFGVIAQDVQEVFPVAVRERPDGSLAVDYEKLSALAFAAIVELKAEVDALKRG